MASEVKVQRLLTIKQLAKETGVPVWRWHELFAKTLGPRHIRIGKTIRVNEVALTEWLSEQESKTRQETERVDG